MLNITFVDIPTTPTASGMESFGYLMTIFSR